MEGEMNPGYSLRICPDCGELKEMHQLAARCIECRIKNDHRKSLARTPRSKYKAGRGA